MLKPLVKDCNKHTQIGVVVNGPPFIDPIVLDPIRLMDYKKYTYWSDLIEKLPFDYLSNIEGVYTIHVTVGETEEFNWET